MPRAVPLERVIERLVEMEDFYAAAPMPDSQDIFAALGILGEAESDVLR